jgi:hypothetical protein
MEEIFLKSYYADEDMYVFVHFRGEDAIRQIELTTAFKRFMSEDSPFDGDSMLYDQDFSDLTLDERSSFITEEEFDEIWNNR